MSVTIPKEKRQPGILSLKIVTITKNICWHLVFHTWLLVTGWCNEKDITKKIQCKLEFKIFVFVFSGNQLRTKKLRKTKKTWEPGWIYPTGLPRRNLAGVLPRVMGVFLIGMGVKVVVVLNFWPNHVGPVQVAASNQMRTMRKIRGCFSHKEMRKKKPF